MFDAQGRPLGIGHVRPEPVKFQVVRGDAPYPLGAPLSASLPPAPAGPAGGVPPLRMPGPGEYEREPRTPTPKLPGRHVPEARRRPPRKQSSAADSAAQATAMLQE